jgi:hypothetical protein
LLDRQVSCKHCNHVFLAVVTGASVAAPSATIRLREALSSSRDLIGQVHLLRDWLARATTELAASRQTIEALRRDRDRIAAELTALRLERDGGFLLRDRPARSPVLDPGARLGSLMDLHEPRFPAIKPRLRTVSAEPSDSDKFKGTKWPALTEDSDETKPSA